jgi:aryl-alcohol dehydrogenase-like predicted oxidoreductase
MAKINETDLDVFPLALGGNVFGWTANEAESFAVLDVYAEAGGNFIDTADMYSAWAPGNSGGESETIIGRWMAARKNRSTMVIATKVGMHPQLSGLKAETIRKAVDRSLERLQTDYIDLYYAHVDDQKVPLEETLGAFTELIRNRSVRYIGASNYSATRLAEALQVSKQHQFAGYVALQQHYNLVEREGYEGELREIVEKEDLVSIPYYGLASGFLTGKYRPGSTTTGARASKASSYLNDKGLRVLAGLDEISARYQVAPATVALAWLREQPTVVAPIASARTVDQLPDLMASARLRLSEEDLRLLSEVSG